MDLADKEIAALSSSKLVAQLGASSGGSLAISKANGSQQTLVESLLNKVVIENDESYVCKADLGVCELTNGVEGGESSSVKELENSMGSFQIKPRGFGMGQGWLMASSADCGVNGSGGGDEGLSASISELKGLLVQMTGTLRAQHEEIESLKNVRKSFCFFLIMVDLKILQNVVKGRERVAYFSGFDEKYNY